MNKKVLLMGTHNSGKTSMRSIIFANYIARDTSRLGATVNVENSTVKFLGNLSLSLWDLGGQDKYMKKYFSSQRDHIFSNVEVLIYVFDSKSKDEQLDLEQYKETLKAITEFSPRCKIFCLLHKMDLIKEDQRQQVFIEKAAVLRNLTAPLKMTPFQTSIWDETLYKAWSSIVYSLIPNAHELETHLQRFCQLAESNEVVLFEKATFLVISHSALENGEVVNLNNQIDADPHRFEKISNIIKQFKLSCSKTQSQFKSMEIRNSKFSAYIDEFTPNTYIMVITYDTQIYSAATMINVQLAKKHFEPLITN
eukprot:TRINITY_DN1629_c0_g2_i1.p1 TRINITY_DN1629_c0_g2~~TRINITY_DN1629_c0_g2_i1.p1  ORF type:complete len:309 (-),score=50.45 TRINITY_DN1629_c0_g2_i1:88-1014(-)